MNNQGHDNTQSAKGNRMISGDLFEGIAVSEYCDQTFEIQSEGRRGQIIMRVTQQNPDRICVGFLFLLDAPMRFRVDVLVPDECTNARVSLQDQELIGFFSPDIPDDLEPMISVPCGQHDKISTLHPGAFQSVNFRWESGDVLKFYFYYGQYSLHPGDPLV